LAGLLGGYLAYCAGLRHGRAQGEKLGRNKEIEKNESLANAIKKEFG
jgi:hypothetical protein